MYQWHAYRGHCQHRQSFSKNRKTSTHQRCWNAFLQHLLESIPTHLDICSNALGSLGDHALRVLNHWMEATWNLKEGSRIILHIWNIGFIITTKASSQVFEEGFCPLPLKTPTTAGRGGHISAEKGGGLNPL